eukprot:446953-Rhodomonas_salina.1
MLVAGAEFSGGEKDRERRAFKACLQCTLGKRQCENERPCGSCSARGLECKEKFKEVEVPHRKHAISARNGSSSATSKRHVCSSHPRAVQLVFFLSGMCLGQIIEHNARARKAGDHVVTTMWCRWAVPQAGVGVRMPAVDTRRERKAKSCATAA